MFFSPTKKLLEITKNQLFFPFGQFPLFGIKPKEIFRFVIPAAASCRGGEEADTFGSFSRACQRGYFGGACCEVVEKAPAEPGLFVRYYI